MSGKPHGGESRGCFLKTLTLHWDNTTIDTAAGWCPSWTRVRATVTPLKTTQDNRLSTSFLIPTHLLPRISQ